MHERDAKESLANILQYLSEEAVKILPEPVVDLDVTPLILHPSELQAPSRALW